MFRGYMVDEAAIQPDIAGGAVSIDDREPRPWDERGRNSTLWTPIAIVKQEDVELHTLSYYPPVFAQPPELSLSCDSRKTVSETPQHPQHESDHAHCTRNNKPSKKFL
jgi:hypothetical protein